MLMHRLLSATLALMPLALPLPAPAQGSPAAPAPAKASAPSTAWSEGVVKKVQAKEGQVTIAHGPLVNLGMGPMTMTFRLKTPGLVAGVKDGSKVRFVAENVNGELTVVALQAAR